MDDVYKYYELKKISFIIWCFIIFYSNGGHDYNMCTTWCPVITFNAFVLLIKTIVINIILS